jgi:DNA-directed RNA polymerase specialized sigma24 family protein
MDSPRLLSLQQYATLGDQQAREDLTEYLVGRITGILETELRGVDASIINDAVEDVVLSHLGHPAAYDSTRARVDTFLTRAAKWRVHDTLRRDRRRRSAEQAGIEESARVVGPAVLSPEPGEVREPWGVIARLNGDLTDVQWAVVQPLLAPGSRPPRRGRRQGDPRAVFNAVLWQMRSGAPWRFLPKRYPPYQSCHRRFQAWRASGLLRGALQKLAEAVLCEEANR